MKLFVVTSLKEYMDEVHKIFKQAKINVFSATDIIGFKDDQPVNHLAEWFASGDEKFDSLLIFSFTADGNVDYAMDLIKNYNEESETKFPIRAFVMPVEKSI